MTPKTLTELRNALHHERKAMFSAVAGAEADLNAITEAYDPELEERAKEERDARVYAALDDRGKRTIDAIDGALRRMADGRYGECAECGRQIALGRLRALPATPFCFRCAEITERVGAAAA